MSSSVARAIEAAIEWFREEGLFEGARPAPPPSVLDGARVENPAAPAEAALPDRPPAGGVPAVSADRRPKPPRRPE